MTGSYIDNFRYLFQPYVQYNQYYRKVDSRMEFIQLMILMIYLLKS